MSLDSHEDSTYNNVVIDNAVIVLRRRKVSNPDRSIDSKILDAAREEFLSKPYDSVSLRVICSKAGVTTGAFYNRYSNKEELFDAMIDNPRKVFIYRLSGDFLLHLPASDHCFRSSVALPVLELQHEMT